MPTRSRPSAHRDAALKRRRLVEAIDASDGNLSEAARRLGIGRSTLYRWLDQAGVEVVRQARPAPSRSVEG